MLKSPRNLSWLAIAAVCALFLSCDQSSAPLPDADVMQEPSVVDPYWDGLARESIQLGQTLLVVRGSRGLAGCTYLNVDTFERGGEACAIIPAADFDGMLDAEVTAATSQAQALGIKVGMPGRQALELLR